VIDMSQIERDANRLMPGASAARYSTCRLWLRDSAEIRSGADHKPQFVFASRSDARLGEKPMDGKCVRDSDNVYTAKKKTKS
jgi:hypothetical protein